MPHRAPPDAGQAAVEFVAVLPLIALVIALAWQAVLAGHAAWAASAAARRRARAPAARAPRPATLEAGLRVSRPAADAVELSLRVPPVVPAVQLGRISA